MDEEKATVDIDEEVLDTVIKEALVKRFLTPRSLQISYYPENGNLSIEQIDDGNANIMEIYGILQAAVEYMKEQILFKEGVTDNEDIDGEKE